MSDTGDWSPDEPAGTETYESWDEALDADDEVDPTAIGSEGERSLDRQLVVDDAELDEAGVVLDDPELMATLDGDIDDPDGVGAGVGSAGDRLDDEGWDLDAGERPPEEDWDTDDE
jgi:hypothetical protein